MNKSKQRATSLFKQALTVDKPKDYEDEVKSCVSIKENGRNNALLEVKPAGKNRRSKYRNKDQCASQCDARSIQALLDADEPEPEPTPVPVFQHVEKSEISMGDHRIE